MSGVEHLYDLSHDLVAREPFAARKACQNQFREEISPLFTTHDALVDNAKSYVHPARCTGPHHHQGSNRIPSRGADIVLSVNFCKRKHSGTALTRAVALHFRIQYDARRNPASQDAQFPEQVGLRMGSRCSQHIHGAMGHCCQESGNWPCSKGGAQYPAARLPSRPFERSKAVPPMTAIRVLNELRFAKVGFAIKKKLVNLGSTVDEDARRASKFESDNISVARGEGRQESEHVRSPRLIIEAARVGLRWTGWGRRHQRPLPADMAVRQ